MNEIKTLYFESTTSTNDVVRDYDRPWTVAISEEQSRGRGQRGNSWESEKGMNLTLSLLIKPQFLHIQDQFYISEVVSLGVVEALRSVGLTARIKWPNDIYVEDRKICGILIENDISGGGYIKRSVVGIGLNVNQRVFVSDAPNPTSCALELGGDISRKDLLAALYDSIYSLYGALEAGDRATLESRYKSVLYRKGTPARYSDKDGEFTGTILDVLPTGELIVDRSGTQQSYLFKEITFLLP